MKGVAISRESLFGMMQAYKVTSLLKTAVSMGVFDHLAAGPASADTVARGLGCAPRGMRILLNALAAVGLAEERDGHYALPPGAEPLLVSGSPAYLGDMVKVMSSDWEWDALKRLDDAVRRGGTVMEVHAETPGYEYWEDFAAYAVAVARPTADVVADALKSWASGRDTMDVLDVACGHGLYGLTLAQRNPQAQVWALDWPNVLTQVDRHADQAGVADRVHHVPGDMFEVPLGGPYDVILVTNVLHHFSEEKAGELLARLAPALRPDGKIVLVGFTLGDENPADDPAPHLFSILMLAWTFEGEVHSIEAYDRMLTRAGFTGGRRHDVPGLAFRVLVASRSE
ncbi:class I SAM-dependent methyltransferase [Spongiactinospora sp. TRM90649]|uniref:class I SAM-dependent methyltransferase n=1 Tax=Spongiactinospora sp. TRM90649 TaxID=3031114 RepID=UPI0023F7A573|nr:class I SAM-dependent methyltransferase [Spongiactinospora sp. TRM90649]MDF5753655.1 class I SAM-dependent methyltransferase [Spongiactinospora sp. TRM90649]